ncbi:hypothetical protein N7462_004428 [Penicillium macrosclerotiorum]|uniref:uncharacterized protein n=1 Tax=Penicillium macrosclerotiorum TaxID=303699 RepID=UPI0025467492|nr:uncharacterized protein N7462_004428 [Penicillium macrosclerotiorum]KAJ5690036.1 hypothetical protein N7462_004428 [Penicillium macrosclerotiorum]
MSTVSQNKTGYDHDNLRHVVITATCFAFILSTTAVAFRILSRKVNGTGLFIDDFFMISALVFEWGISIAGVVLLYNGLGTHIVYVKPEQLTVYLKTLFTGSILYTLCIASIKLSILMLYRRLFPVKAMNIGVKIVSSIVVLWAACGILAGCFTCIPTKKLWSPEVPGGCMDLGKFYYGLQIPNIATDAIILFMPMHTVWGLPISRAQKVGLSAIFVVGFLTLIFDIIRLVALIDLSKSGDDITYNQVNSSVWTCIEPAVGIVAACLSNMRPIFKLMHRKFWLRYIGSTAHTSQQDMITTGPTDQHEKPEWTRDTPSPNGDTLHSHSDSQSRSPKQCSV